MDEKLRQIKMLLMDVDGVMTDGRFFYLDNGAEAKAFDVKDGFALRLAAKTGLKTGIITGKMSPIVERRAKELDINEFHQGFFNKVEVYNQIKKRQGLFDAEIAYIGDDLFDLGVLKLVGFSACPANAVPEVKQIVDYVCERDGGEGAVREIIEMILKSKHKWGILVDKFIEGRTF
jgi:3-deoxy-D-manno-octulosonate 8-phosphate phosphatase (KDO 8-P phosphatase)